MTNGMFYRSIFIDLFLKLSKGIISATPCQTTQQRCQIGELNSKSTIEWFDAGAWHVANLDRAFLFESFPCCSWPALCRGGAAHNVWLTHAKANRDNTVVLHPVSWNCCQETTTMQTKNIDQIWPFQPTSCWSCFNLLVAQFSHKISAVTNPAARGSSVQMSSILSCSAARPGLGRPAKAQTVPRQHTRHQSTRPMFVFVRTKPKTE